MKVLLDLPSETLSEYRKIAIIRRSSRKAAMEKVLIEFAPVFNYEELMNPKKKKWTKLLS